MKTIIAIKGHAIRHKEVIEILEMLGGENKFGHCGYNPNVAYYICDDNIIRCDCVPNIYPNIYKCVDYTLEEFLEKYPYKVGDKVTLDKWPCTITGMSWEYDDIIYYVQGIDFSKGVYSKDKDLQPYKETMNTKIAIKGHKTRGKEVIEILEMMGGVNTYKYSGDNEEICFCIGCATKMIYYEWINDCYGDESILVLSIEEFLEKYPYKIGDKVIVTGLPEYPKIINFMEWFDGDIHYSFDNETWFPPSGLNLYKEETMETITIDDFKANTKEWLIDKLHGMVISKAIKTIGDIHEELHKPQYPKTYEECCKVLGIDSDNYLSIRNLYRDDGDKETTDYESDLLTKRCILEKFDHLWELTICRDAYWKIAGEQMGLDKPWKPDWLDISTYKYCIYYVGDEIKKQPMSEVHHFLAFPTKEMSGVFFENFKELIESCEYFL